MKNNPPSDEAQILPFASAKEFETWLLKNHEKTEGVWMKMAKKGSGISSITSDEAVDVGLCWGWISGIRKSLDDKYYLQKYVPRRPRSIWSQVNVRKVAELTMAGKMQEPGIKEVEAAKRDGRWEDAYIPQSEAVIPPDVAEAFNKNPIAKEHYDAANKTQKYQLIFEILKTTNQATRDARIKKLIDTLNNK